MSLIGYEHNVNAIQKFDARYDVLRTYPRLFPVSMYASRRA